MILGFFILCFVALGVLDTLCVALVGDYSVFSLTGTQLKSCCFWEDIKWRFMIIVETLCSGFSLNRFSAVLTTMKRFLSKLTPRQMGFTNSNSFFVKLSTKKQHYYNQCSSSWSDKPESSVRFWVFCFVVDCCRISKKRLNLFLWILGITMLFSGFVFPLHTMERHHLLSSLGLTLFDQG